MSSEDAPNVLFERERGVSSLHITRDVAHAVIATGSDGLRTSKTLEAFRVLAEASIPIFLVKLHRSAITLAVAGADHSRVGDALAPVGLSARVRRDLALIAVRATSMQELLGVMADTADALDAAGAHMIETADAHDAVQCLIEESHLEVAVNALRKTFDLELSAVVERPIDAAAV